MGRALLLRPSGRSLSTKNYLRVELDPPALLIITMACRSWERSMYPTVSVNTIKDCVTFSFYLISTLLRSILPVMTAVADTVKDPSPKKILYRPLMLLLHPKLVMHPLLYQAIPKQNFQTQCRIRKSSQAPFQVSHQVSPNIRQFSSVLNQVFYKAPPIKNPFFLLHQILVVRLLALHCQVFHTSQAQFQVSH